MIRRSTWILVLIFIAVLGVTIYLNKTSTSLVALTPTPTQLLDVLPGWEGKQATVIQFQDKQGVSTKVERTSQTNWIFIPPVPGKSIDQGKIQELISSIISMKVAAQINPDLSPDATGMNAPSYVIVITAEDGTQKTIQIGKMNPTQTGYYVKVGDSLQVVSSTSVDAITEKLSVDSLSVEITPAPAGPEVPTPSEQ